MNGTPVSYRVVRYRRLRLLSRLIAFIYVDVLEASRCLVSLLTRQAMCHESEPKRESVWGQGETCEDIHGEADEGI